MNIDRSVAPGIYPYMSQLRILVVDDDTAFRNGVERYLKLKGYEHVRVAYSGEAALEMVKDEHPQIVLMDLYLPRMNGLTALREIRKINDRIQVCMLTSEADQEYRDLAAKFGALDYLVKPISLEELVTHIEKKLQDEPPTSNAA
jgi:DNA-binding response OmpR family regulator